MLHHHQDDRELYDEVEWASLHLTLVMNYKFFAKTDDFKMERVKYITSWPSAADISAFCIVLRLSVCHKIRGPRHAKIEIKFIHLSNPLDPSLHFYFPDNLQQLIPKLQKNIKIEDALQCFSLYNPSSWIQNTNSWGGLAISPKMLKDGIMTRGFLN